MSAYHTYPSRGTRTMGWTRANDPSPASHHHKDVLTKYGSKPPTSSSGKHLKVGSRNGLSSSKSSLINTELPHLEHPKSSKLGLQVQGKTATTPISPHRECFPAINNNSRSQMNLSNNNKDDDSNTNIPLTPTGQRENQSKTAIVNKPEELLQMINNPYMCVNSLLLVNEETVVVNYEYIEEAYEPLSTVNVALAAYTTAHARLKLYSYLEQLGERVLYYDTDSVIYIGREGEYDVPLGEFIGQMTDELEGVYGTGSYITEFVSGGPKNYSYDVYSTRDKKIHTACKIKGISLNHKTCKLVNKNKMKQMILYDNTPIPIVSSNIRRTKDHKVVTREETKTYRVNSTKRKFNGSGSVPFGYIKRSCVKKL